MLIDIKNIKILYKKFLLSLEKNRHINDIKEFFNNILLDIKKHKIKIVIIIAVIITFTFCSILYIKFTHYKKSIKEQENDSLFYKDPGAPRIIIEPVDTSIGLEYQVTVLSFMVVIL